MSFVSYKQNVSAYKLEYFIFLLLTEISIKLPLVQCKWKERIQKSPYQWNNKVYLNYFPIIHGNYLISSNLEDGQKLDMKAG
jgi:hypothetical protein